MTRGKQPILMFYTGVYIFDKSLSVFFASALSFFKYVLDFLSFSFEKSKVSFFSV
jgi:hypothetical protein